MKVPPMVPPKKQRATRTLGYLNKEYGIAREIELAHRAGYAAGFAAAVAMLQEPSAELVEDAWQRAGQLEGWGAIGNRTLVKGVLRAAASALADSAEEGT